MARSVVLIGIISMALFGCMSGELSTPGPEGAQESEAIAPDQPAPDDTGYIEIQPRVCDEPELADDSPATSRAGQRIPPPTCDDPPSGCGGPRDPRYTDYSEVVTSQDDQVQKTCNGYNLIGQYITCRDYQRCTRTNTYLHTFICMDGGAYWINWVSLASSVLTCQTSYYSSCPLGFTQDVCW